MTLLSRILGLVREIVFATTFGATAQMDAFLVAFKIPNFMRRLFAEGAFSQAFVPVLSEYKTNEDKAAVKDLIAHVSGLLGLVVFCIAIFGMIFSFIFVTIFAPGFWQHPEKFSLAEQMLRIMFPYLFFIALTALSGGVLNTYSKFSVPAFTPVILNVVLITMTLTTAKHFAHPEIAVAWGVLLAGLLQLLFQLPFLWKMGLLVWPKIKRNHAGVKKILRLMLPALFGASVVQIGLLIDTIFASFLQTGSVSWLYYSDRLMQFPLGVFGVALATVVLPHLSKSHAAQNTHDYNQALNWSFRLVILVSIPAMAGLMVLAYPMVSTIYQYGHFDGVDAAKTELALIAITSGLFFFIWTKVLVSAFYAKQDTKTPVKVACFALGTNVIANAILIWPLAYIGIALATVIGSVVNAVALFIVLHKRGLYRVSGRLKRVIVSTLLSTVVMVLVLLFFRGDLWQTMPLLGRIYHLTALIGLGVAVYVIMAFVCGIRKRDLTL